MLYLLRIVLIITIVVLLIRALSRPLETKKHVSDNQSGRKSSSRRVSEKTGDYVDYEEVEKK